LAKTHAPHENQMRRTEAMSLTARMAGCLALSTLLFSPSAAVASGFAVEEQGARAASLSGSFTALATDPSAVFYNPAGLAFQKGRHFSLGGVATSQATDITGEGPVPVAGTLEKSDLGMGVLPNVYYGQQFSRTVSFGLGVTAPYDAQARWLEPAGFTGRFVCLDCQLRSYSVNPVVALRLEDRLAVGLGVDLQFSELMMTRRLLPSPNPFAPKQVDVAEMTVDSDWASSVGFNIGVLAKPTESLSIGLAYRHKVRMDYTGLGDFDQILTGDATVDSAVALKLPPKQAFQTAIEFPATLRGGLAYRFGDWTISGDAVAYFWSSFMRLNIIFPDATDYSLSIPTRFGTAWRGSMGIERVLGDHWAVRAGYAYDRSPQATTTLQPFFHDEDRYSFTAGAGWKSGTTEIDAFARYSSASRSTLGTSELGYDGLYKTTGLSFGLNLTFGF
jgi:long-chain fatty acid transport protein